MINVHFSDINPDVKGIYMTMVRHDTVRNGEKYFNSDRIMLFLKGNAIFRFSDAELRTSPCCALFIPSMTKYTTEFFDDQLILQICFDFVHYRDDVFSNTRFRALPAELYDTDTNTAEDILIDDNLLFMQPFLVKNITDASLRSDSFMNEYRGKRNGYRLRVKSMLLDLLVSMQRLSEESDTERDRSTVDRILSYINEHCDGKLAREELSRIFHYHPGHINRLVMSATGMTLHKYIIEAKLHRAESLLTNTNMPITQIAMQLSFYDSSHFSQIFQKYKGVSPSEYRNMSRRLY